MYRLYFTTYPLKIFKANINCCCSSYFPVNTAVLRVPNQVQKAHPKTKNTKIRRKIEIGTRRRKRIVTKKKTKSAVKISTALARVRTRIVTVLTNTNQTKKRKKINTVPAQVRTKIGTVLRRRIDIRIKREKKKGQRIRRRRVLKIKKRTNQR
jgi:hypothetical protein